MSTWPETSDQGPPPLGGVLGRLGAAAKQSWLRESLEGWEELFSAVVVEWRAVMKKQTKERLHGTGVLKTGNQYLLRPVCATPVQLPSYLSDTAIPNHPPPLFYASGSMWDLSSPTRYRTYHPLRWKYES